MLSIFVDNFHHEIAGISEARVSPFASYGHYCQCKKNLEKKYWLFKKKYSAYESEALDLNQISNLSELGFDQYFTAEAVAFLIDGMSVTKKAEYINALYFSEEFRSISKEVIDITCAHHLLSDFTSDKDVMLCKVLSFSNHEEIDAMYHDSFPWLVAPKPLSDDSVLEIFTDLIEEELLEGKFISLFLMGLTPRQLNMICNSASNILSADDSLCLLIRGGMVKYAPLVNSFLLQSESPVKLVKEIRNVLGSYLDEIVSYDIQLSAWQDDPEALGKFQKEFAINWPKYEDDLAGKRLLSGFPLSSVINQANKSAMNTPSVLLMDMFEKYQSLHNAEEEHGTVSV